MTLSVLFNYTNAAPSDHRKPTENKPKPTENIAKSENFRFLRFFRFLLFSDFYVFFLQRAAATEAVEVIPSVPTTRPTDVFASTALPGRLATLDIGVTSPHASGAGGDCCDSMHQRELSIMRIT